MDYRDVLLRLAMALLAGSIIGGEREFRQKRAGLRTNVLVAVGAAVFCLISASLENETSATRIAAQIASGIGFLGAGVILRDGANVRGLDTAATLWCSAAAGATAGIGLFAISASASFLILAVNLFLPRSRPKADDSPDRQYGWAERYELAFHCHPAAERAIRDRVLGLADAEQFLVAGIRNRPAPGGAHRITLTLAGRLRCDPLMARLSTDIAAIDGVTEVWWRWIDPVLAARKRRDVAAPAPAGHLCLPRPETAWR